MPAAEFPEIYDRLKSIIEPYAREFHVTYDEPTGYGVDMAPEGERDPTTWFAGVRLGKQYVSYYLMPVYVEPSLLDDISPELRRRMQGKSCFNFKSVDEDMFEELAELTRHGYELSARDSSWGVQRRMAHDMAHRQSHEEATGLMLTPGGTTSTKQREALDAVEAELRAILVTYEDKLETAEIYGMEVLRRNGAKAHDWFAGVQQVNGIVKFNFLPMHGHPELLEGVSPALLKKRTGASVFKFTEPDDALMEDLGALVARGFKLYAGKRKRG